MQTEIRVSVFICRSWMFSRHISAFGLFHFYVTYYKDTYLRAWPRLPVKYLVSWCHQWIVQILAVIKPRWVSVTLTHRRQKLHKSGRAKTLHSFPVVISYTSSPQPLPSHFFHFPSPSFFLPPFSPPLPLVSSPAGPWQSPSRKHFSINQSKCSFVGRLLNNVLRGAC